MTPGPEAHCPLHPENPAVAICSRCGSFACRLCARVEGSDWFCSKCTSGFRPRADLGTRFVANLVDNGVIIAPLLVGAFMLAFAIGPALSGTGSKAPLVVVGVLTALGSLGAVAGQIVAQVVWGQSLGKRWLKLKVVQVNGQPAEWWRVVLLRNLAFHALAQLCGLVALIDPLLIFGADQRCLHDYLAGTMVIDVTNDEQP
jgi:uncharacterized RDD family membrane protein YckC